MAVRRSPGVVRDAIITYMQTLKGASASTVAIHRAVEEALGGEVAQSSVRSYLRLNPNTFAQTSRGQYSLAAPMTATAVPLRLVVDEGRPMRVPHLGRPVFTFGQASLYQADCLDWLAAQEPNSLHACVTDPPYGLVEYTELEQAKLRARRGGVWRIPPSFDGHQRAPLPRFTTLTEADLEQLQRFFVEWGEAVRRVLVPGAHVVVAANPLVSHLVSVSLHQAGLERRGEIVRLVQTMRGGDRPKNAHDEFPDVSVMPRSQWEPWLLFRKVPQGRISDNLRKWKTGGLRRISDSQPFGDVIRSGPTRPTERRLANHPSLKPQEFLRKLVRAVLPLGEGVVLDPFAGSGSTLAAAEAVGYESVGVELDPDYVAVARKAIPSLARLKVGPAG